MLVLTIKDSNPRDPYIFFHNGTYYALFSYNNCLWMKSAKRLEQIKDAKKLLVYKPEDEYRHSLWAPELHIIDNISYIYVTMAKEVGKTQHMFVLSNHSNDVLKPYKKISYLKLQDDAWGIDGTILANNNQLYYVYSAFGKYEGEMYQALYISKMVNPYTLKGEPCLLSRSQYDWEKIGCEGNIRPYVNEGPFAIYHEDKTFIVYSASGCWTNHYCLGLLELKGDDVLDSKSWYKHDKPILDNTSGFVGPGHASFIQNDPSGKEYCSFHAYIKDSSDGEGAVNAFIYSLSWENGVPKINI